ncbi:elongation factor G [Albidovulum inexpectatum]|uniref:Elongation factor G n=1 Tax=Albidovulum inexpectatum TaxID=196587 RepID=A0A2S5JJK8_9RHOB|nr:elongation factor G [Albidovulum inexpectatum]PPB81696.1 elongation factor G [Albidovulum inexpectatum]
MRCIVFMGPSQSGKTELVHALSTLEGAQPETEDLGRLKITRFAFMGQEWGAIDLHGGPEDARMAGAALMAADAAVLCVTPETESAVLAAPWLRAVESASVPCFLFINKMDAARSRVRDVVAALQGYSSHPIVLRQIPIREDGRIVGAIDLISERAWRYREGGPSQLIEMPRDAAERENEARAELMEQMSDYDDALLEELIEDHEPGSDALFHIVRRETQERQIVPAFLGAASHRNGVLRLMKALRHEVPEVEVLRDRLGNDRAVAVAFHGQMRKHLGKCVLLRSLGATLHVGDKLAGAGIGGLIGPGGKAGADRIPPGALGLAVKSDHLSAGSVPSPDSAAPAPDWARSCPPSLARIIRPENERDETRLSAALQRLAEIDPMLSVEQDTGSGHPVVRFQGPIHEREVLAILAEEMGLSVATEAPAPRYLETASQSVEHHYRHRKQTGGAGQFADIAFTLRPNSRGSGFEFSETVKGGAVPRNYIPAVEEGFRDALGQGPLGFPVTDIVVTLTDGKHHAVDSSDHAFRTAARMGLREALAKAGPVLLQPINRVTIHVPSVHSGAMVSLISSLKGQVLGFEPHPAHRGWDLFRGLLPASAEEDLVMALGSATQGTAWHQSEFDHYEEIHGKEAERIAKERAKASA